jgi:REP element-mobilizing transposase RayT
MNARRRFRPLTKPLVIHVYIHLDQGLIAYWEMHDGRHTPLTHPFGYDTFITCLERTLIYSAVTVAGIAIMPNHVHLLLVLTRHRLSLRETVRRYNARYKGERPPLDLRKDKAQLRKERKRMLDPSNFTQRVFSAWGKAMAAYTRDRFELDVIHTCVVGDRHKETVAASVYVARILELYVDLNPSRAGLAATDPDRPLCTREFLCHPRLRRIINGFTAFVELAFGSRVRPPVSPGKARLVYFAARKAELQRLGEARRNALSADIAAGSSVIPFDPLDPAGCPYMTCGGAIGYARDLRDFLADCYAADLLTRPFVAAVRGAGIFALRVLRRRTGRRKPPESAPDPPSTPLR